MARSIYLQQTVHGYLDGHTLLGSSIRLNPKQARSLLIMSDMAGAGGVLGADGYVTGYPLGDGKHYVLAKTWPAPEIPRPGCVWTHSLIIKNEDLATVSTPDCFTKAFRRPRSTNDLEYNAEISVDIDEADINAKLKERSTVAKSLLWALYGFPGKSIYYSRDDVGIQNIVLELWMQQWPGLRSNFKFCTSVARDRSREGFIFDLQIAREGVRSVSSVFRSSIDASKLRIEDKAWLEVALKDLCDHKFNGLRDFFRENVGLTSRKREMFAPLSELFTLLDSSNEDSSYEAAISILEGASLERVGPTIVRGIMLLLVRSDAEPSQEALKFFVRNIELLHDIEIERAAIKIGRHLWHADPTAASDTSETNETRAYFNRFYISIAEPKDLISGASLHADVIPQLIFLRPDLLTHTEIWRCIPNPIELVSSLSQMDDDTRSKIAISLLQSDVVKPDAWELRKIPASILWHAIQASLSQGSDKNRSISKDWIKALCSDNDSLTQDLACGFVTNAEALVYISQSTYPDSIYNDYGADPWLTALFASKAGSQSAVNTYLMAYSLARAFGWRTKQPVDLMSYAFRHVYIEAKHDRLRKLEWSLVQSKLPNALFHDWDKCKRLMLGAAQLFSNNWGDPIKFAELLDSENDFRELVYATRDIYGGKSYLKYVRGELKYRGRYEEFRSIIKNVI